MYDLPIWYAESKVFDLWEWLTNKDRLALRTVVMALSLVLASLGHQNDLGGFAGFVLIITIRWFNLLYHHELGYQMNLVRFLTAVLIYMDAYALVNWFWNGAGTLSGRLAWILLWLSDYILWAHHINRPRKRRKPLPEHLKELFAGLDWLPKPVADH